MPWIIEISWVKWNVVSKKCEIIITQKANIHNCASIILIIKLQFFSFPLVMISETGYCVGLLQIKLYGIFAHTYPSPSLSLSLSRPLSPSVNIYTYKSIRKHQRQRQTTVIQRIQCISLSRGWCTAFNVCIVFLSNGFNISNHSITSCWVNAYKKKTIYNQNI